MHVEDIVKAASQLPEEDRASIASRLIHSLDAAHHWISDEEVSARMREAEEDPSVLISFDQFYSGIKRSGT